MADINETPTYNLGVVTKETGINPDTLRAWERRYGLPQPARSEGGHRLYSQHDIEVISWLMSRQNEGMSISKAVKLWNTLKAEGKDPLQEMPTLITTETKRQGIEFPPGTQVAEYAQAWIDACMAFDEPSAEGIVSHAFAMYPPEVVCFDILFAGLSQIGSYWYQGEATVQQEHFASALVERRINALLAAATTPARKDKVIIACPPGEDHTLAALLVAYLLKQRGWEAVYLGADVPLNQLEATVDAVKPALVVATSQQLSAAASLLDVATRLLDVGTQIAFGGLIFNRLPDLVPLFPGYFLGHQLRDGIRVLEQILTSAVPPANKPKAVDLDVRLLKAYQEVLPAVENDISLPPESSISFDYVPIANQYLAEGIMASLKLGNVAFVQVELDWIEGLMNNFDLPIEALQGYLNSYSRSISKHLGDLGEPISAVLEKAGRHLDMAQ
jgi:DNA-binding transcriptional MerR regulator/DNA-directed RNA polymerase subunit L